VKLSLVVAVSKNNVIGGDNKLLWHLPADLKHFKNITYGHSIIMGRKTFESIGRALPGRRNIVVTRQEYFNAEGCTVVKSLQAAVDLCQDEKEVFIIGGAEVYRQAIHAADKIYLTRIYKAFEGDVFFPELSFSDWKLTKYQRFHADDSNHYEYSFAEYERS
jgi:dihydrofolate reductase